MVSTARRAGPPTPTWPYRFGVRMVGDALRDFVITPLVKHWVSIGTQGSDHLRDLRTPAIFIFNHSDDFDVPVIYAGLPRRIRRRLCVATGENIIAEHRALATIIRLCFAGFAFARRAPYRPSLNYVAELIASGHHVLLAPEGQLSVNGELDQFKSGIGLLAVTLGVPVIPMRLDGIWGTVPMHALWPQRHSDVTLRIAEPRRFASDAKYREVTLALREAVLSL
ncbi:MAG: lysophospholipid acyltransferase family protein [Acidimicrobiales bacterium]